MPRFLTPSKVDALHAFFEESSNLLTKARDEIKKDGEIGIPPPSPDMILLSRTSPFGSFVRRAKIEFDRLQFSDSVSLWTSFVRWRQDTAGSWAKRNSGLRRWAGDKALSEGEVQWGVEATEMFETINYHGVLEGENVEGSLSTDDVEKLLEFQVDQMQSIFLDAWRAGDYPNSFDYLHRYFDYTMQNRDRLFYQYALMNLAVLQADFGCLDEAVAAMLETVTTARENKDLACLNFALNWLYHFNKAHPNIISAADSPNMLGAEREGLAFIRLRAKESGMWTLWSSSLLSEAKMGLSNGESITTVFENILKSSQLITDRNMKGMMGGQMAMYSSLWSRLGVVSLSRQYCNVFLSAHARYSLFDDTLKFTCRIAHLLADRGHYDEAMGRLESLDENSLRSWKANQYWLRYQAILRLKRDLHHNNLDGADQLLVQLLQGGDPDGDPELSFEIDLLHIDYLTRRADFTSALANIERLALAIKETGDDVNLRVKLLTLKALLQDKVGRPQRGFSIAVRAASIAWHARLIPGLWVAIGVIANILTSLGEFQAASQILVSVIPRALECENCALTAQLYSFLVDAYMGIAGFADSGSLKRTQNLTKCLEFIDIAFSEYSAIEDINGQCQMMAKKATIMKVLGDNVQANDYASAYLDLKKEAALAMA
ncbi:hypothetical protein OIDMADRAFT_99747 [Oidiodendron maius Zn]|uniref:Anaphase-promoting complex subunit 5 n=1 Tax=Oidiodendron maius (strain Zn) TaxID=913774 RepID=A0A0C3HZS1_OIDMZ|nr:hypothetical protein OIDMADRAFT_99747 [Oidiodendron maius Zn]